MELRWDKEPDLAELRHLHDLLSREPERAIAGLQCLADRGSLASMWYLASTYLEQRTQPDARDKAIYWYERLKEAGFVQARHMLGRIFYEKRSFSVAFGEFAAGAHQGYPPSMYRLARMYSNREETNVDKVKYEYWLGAAAAKGHLFAKRDLMGLYLTRIFRPKTFLRGIAILVTLPIDLARLKALKENSNELERRIIC